MASTRRKIPIVAGILSFIVPGLGIIYAGEKLKGLFYMGIAVFVLSSMITLRYLFLPYLIILGFWIFVIWIYNIADSYREAVRYNNRLDMLERFDQREAWRKIQEKEQSNNTDITNPPSV
jgi:hypothetical protein